jgi:hypothetical protein
MVRQAQLVLLLFYYRLYVSTYIQVIFRHFDRRVRKCSACAVRHTETSTILTNINVVCIYVFYLYEHDGIPTCTAFTDSPVKRPEDDLYVGRNM